MKRLHLVANRVLPYPGGLQESVIRIGAGLKHAGFPVRVYTLNQPEGYRCPPPGYPELPVVHLECPELLLEPYQEAELADLRAAEEARGRSLALERALADQKRRHPEADHVLMSFYASGTGFLAQMAAANLGIPHIVSVRGTDLELDAFDARKLCRLRTAIEGASLVVTTNRQQASALSALFRLRRPVRVIHNALPEAASRPCWEPPPGETIRLVSDCGFSVRKATHLLLRAVAALLEAGRDVTLTVLGGIFWLESRPWWEAIQQRYQSAYPGRFFFPGHVGHDEVDRYLLSSHVYCSASLAEGSSLGRLRALTLGIPIVATAVGGIDEVVDGCRHVFLCPPADLEALTEALATAVTAVRQGSVRAEPACIEHVRRHFALERERREWAAAVEACGC